MKHANPVFVLLCISMLSSPTVFSSPLSCETTVFGFNKYVKTTNQTNTFTGNFSVSNSTNTFAIGGRPHTPGHWHRTPIPGPGGTGRLSSVSPAAARAVQAALL